MPPTAPPLAGNAPPGYGRVLPPTAPGTAMLGRGEKVRGCHLPGPPAFTAVLADTPQDSY